MLRKWESIQSCTTWVSSIIPKPSITTSIDGRARPIVSSIWTNACLVDVELYLRQITLNLLEKASAFNNMLLDFQVQFPGYLLAQDWK